MGKPLLCATSSLRLTSTRNQKQVIKRSKLGIRLCRCRPKQVRRILEGVALGGLASCLTEVVPVGQDQPDLVLRGFDLHQRGSGHQRRRAALRGTPSVEIRYLVHTRYCAGTGARL